MSGQGEIVRKAESLARRYHSDADFRARMDADPGATLRGEGCSVLPDGAAVSLHVDDEKTMHIVFPPRPARGSAMGDESLVGLSGGYCANCVCFGSGPFGGPCGPRTP